MNDQRWRKSSYSGNGGGNCVEVGTCDAVLVRDSKDPEGVRLAFAPETWQEFAAALKTGG